MTRRVVITGIGLVTPLAANAPATWERLLAGKSGANKVEHVKVDDLPCRIACIVPRVDGRGGGAGDPHAFDPDKVYSTEEAAHWQRLAAGLRGGGIDGFLAAYPMPQQASERMRSVLERAIRQRLSQHENLDAVADALEGVPQSRPVKSRAQLESIAAPTTVIASRDELDPEHPQVVAERWQASIPDAELVIEQEGESPLAWRGGRIVSAVQQTCARVT